MGGIHWCVVMQSYFLLHPPLQFILIRFFLVVNALFLYPMFYSRWWNLHIGCCVVSESNIGAIFVDDLPGQQIRTLSRASRLPGQ